MSTLGVELLGDVSDSSVEEILTAVVDRSMGEEEPVAVTLFIAFVKGVSADVLERVAVSRFECMIRRYQSSEYASWASQVLGGGTEYSPLEGDIPLPGGNNFLVALDALVASRVEEPMRRKEFLCSSLLSLIMSEQLHEYGSQHPAAWADDWEFRKREAERDAAGEQTLVRSEGSASTLDGWCDEPRVRDAEQRAWRSMLDEIRRALQK